MRLLTVVQAMQELCKATKKWAVYFEGKTQLAAPYLRDEIQLLSDGVGIVLCDSEEEMRLIYNQTVGDDGPTETNPYNGPCRVYAVTCSPDGQLLNENT